MLLSYLYILLSAPGMLINGKHQLDLIENWINGVTFLSIGFIAALLSFMIILVLFRHNVWPLLGGARIVAWPLYVAHAIFYASGIIILLSLTLLGVWLLVADFTVYANKDLISEWLYGGGGYLSLLIFLAVASITYPLLYRYLDPIRALKRDPSDMLDVVKMSAKDNF